MASRSDDMDVDDFDTVMEDDVFLNTHIRHNHQVHRANVRDFLEVHGASPPSSANSQRSAGSPAPSLSSWNDSGSFMMQYAASLQQPPEKPKKPIQDITFTVSYTTMKRDNEHGRGNTDAEEACAVCPICQTELADVETTKKETIRKFAKCLHAFCHTCITRWLETKRTCPMCMTDVYDI